MAQFHDVGDEAAAEVLMDFLEADDAAQLQLDMALRQHEGALAMLFLHEAALLQQLDGLAHGAAAGLVGVHQFGFRRQARPFGQPLGADIGKQIGIDLVVFAHALGS
ncbi:hypothetical protein D3C85_1528090 [compost metagenome]